MGYSTAHILQPEIDTRISRYCRVPPLQGLLFLVDWEHVKGLCKFYNANETSNLSDMVTQDVIVSLTLKLTIVHYIPLYIQVFPIYIQKIITEGRR